MAKRGPKRRGRDNRMGFELYEKASRSGEQPWIDLPPQVRGSLVIDADNEGTYGIEADIPNVGIQKYGLLVRQDELGNASEMWPFDSVPRADLTQTKIRLIVDGTRLVGLWGTTK